MNSIRASEYRDFMGATNAELGTSSEVVHSRLYDYRTEANQQIGIFVAEPLKHNGSTIIMPAQHEYRNEPLVMQRAQIMAHHTGGRVALVEMPGTVGLVHPYNNDPRGYDIYSSTEKLEGAQQTPSQLISAARGDFSEHAGLQLDAVTKVLSLQEADPLILFGESMGAATATEMVRHIGQRGLALDAIVLHEVVNPSTKRSIPWLFPLLKNLGGTESQLRNDYFQENEEIGHPIVAFEQSSKANKRLDDARKSITQQAFGGIANGLGMRSGVEPKLLTALKGFGAKTTPSVLLTRGYDSAVTNDQEYAEFTNGLADNGIVVDVAHYKDALEQQRLGHFFLFSLGRQAAFAQNLRALL